MEDEKHIEEDKLKQSTEKLVVLQREQTLNQNAIEQTKEELAEESIEFRELQEEVASVSVDLQTSFRIFMSFAYSIFQQGK